MHNAVPVEILLIGDNKSVPLIVICGVVLQWLQVCRSWSVVYDTSWHCHVATLRTSCHSFRVTGLMIITILIGQLNDAKLKPTIIALFRCNQCKLSSSGCGTYGSYIAKVSDVRFFSRNARIASSHRFGSAALQLYCIRPITSYAVRSAFSVIATLLW